MTKIIISLFLALVVNTQLLAKSYALLVGIDNYKNAPHLSGAVADAEHLEKLLKKHNIYNTHILLNQEANKQAIVSALTSIAHNIKSGDNFYMFYSGHGTSLEDKSLKDIFSKESRLLTLLENSGALLPYDFNKHSASSSLIIGSRDLRPIFQKIDDKGANSLVVFDACFSGRTYRSLPSKRKRRRHYTLPSMNIEFNVPKPHPYESLVYIASTSSSDWAVEDQTTNRGYLMQQLEQCLEGEADSDMDSQVSKEELKHCIDNSNLPQSPQIYPTSTQINPKVFKVYTPLNGHNSKPPKNIRLQVTFDGNHYIVRDQFGEIASFSNKDQVSRYQEAYKILQLQGKKPFSLHALNQNGIKQKMYTVDDEISIHIKSSRPGYLVLFTLDSQGNLYMIEPYPTQTTYLPKNTKIPYTSLTIAAPIGTEMMKGFIISDPNVMKEIQKLSPHNNTGLVNDLSSVYRLLKRLSPYSYDTALLKLTTHEK